jgi:hypothetical protein
MEGAGTGPLQRFQASSGCGKGDCAQTLGTAFWSHPGAAEPGDGTLYVWDKRDQLRAYPLREGRFSPLASVSSVPAKLTSGPTVSADGADLSSGIVWAVTIDSDDQAAQMPGILRAFLASDVSKELYDSDKNRKRDQGGNFSKFTPPVIANGKVYVVSQSGVVTVYGLLNSK